MEIKKHCNKCKVDRIIKPWDVISAGKKRVVCGHCGEVLMNEGEVENWYWRYYADC